MTKLDTSYWHERAIIILVMFGLSFWKTSVLENYLHGVSVADISLGLASILILIWFVVTKRDFNIYGHSIYPFYLLFVAVLSGGVLLLQTLGFFSEIEFFKSLLKIGYYIFISILLIGFLQNIPNDKIYDIVLNVLFVLSIIALYVFYALNSGLELPYGFLYHGSGENYIANNYYRGSDWVVAKGIFSEPSSMGIFLNLGLAYLWHTIGFFKERVGAVKYSVIILSIILTFSLTSYVLLFANLILLVKGRRNKELLKLSVLAVGVVIIVLFAVNGFELLERAISDRILEKVMSGTDNSTMVRLLGSWEVPLIIIQKHPILGVGLGNIGTFSEEIKGSLVYGLYGDDGYIVFAYVLGSLGIAGLIIFGGMLAILMKRNKKSGLIYLLSLFAHGGFVEPVIWIYYALYVNKKNEVYVNEQNNCSERM